MENFVAVQPFDNIPAHGQWLQLTERKTNVGLFSIKHRRSNPNLLVIDNLIKRFEMHREELVPLHYAIGRACCAWLIPKEGRRSVRRAMVMKLLKTLLVNLEQLGLEPFGTSNTAMNWTQIDNYLKGGRVRSAFREAMKAQRFSSHRGESLSAFKSRREGTRPSLPLPTGGWGRALSAVRRLGSSRGGAAQQLQGAFWRETMPLTGPENTPMHDPRKSLHNVHLLGGQGLRGQKKNESYKQAAERLLREAGGETIQAGIGGGAANVWYFDDEDRYMHMLDLGPDLIRMRDEDGELQILTTRSIQKGFQILGFLFAADMDGNIYAAEDEDAGNLQLRHSSFLAGSSVLCAGLITVNRGKLAYISNDSGHYQPSYTNLYRLVRQLSTLLVDLSQTRVDAHGADKMIASAFLARGWMGGHYSRSGALMSGAGYILRGMGQSDEYKYSIQILPDGREYLGYAPKDDFSRDWTKMPPGIYVLSKGEAYQGFSTFKVRVQADGEFLLIGSTIRRT